MLIISHLVIAPWHLPAGLINLIGCLVINYRLMHFRLASDKVGKHKAYILVN